jgi:hypothetical protein
MEMQDMSERRSVSVPIAMRPVVSGIVSLINPLCQEYLNEEYAALGQELAAALARKRPSPLTRGKPEIWACAIVYALGFVNFLFDKTQTPHMRADDLCDFFGVSQSSAANRAKAIRDMFGMYQYDPRWCLPSLIDNNPLVWMLDFDGVIIDVRDMPRDFQVMAYNQKLIPYIPAGEQP